MTEWIKAIWLILLILSSIGMAIEGQKPSPRFMPYVISIIAEICFLVGFLLGELFR